MKAYFHLPFRQAEGVISGLMLMTRYHLTNYSTRINRRINKLDIKINERIGNDINHSIRHTGIKVTNRGKWLPCHKWNVRKGYLKIHVRRHQEKENYLI